MVSRRRTLHLVGAGLVGLAGCSDADRTGTPTGSSRSTSTTAATSTPTPSETDTPTETETPTEPPEPTEEVDVQGELPAWTRALGAPIRSPPVYADGYVVVAAGGTVYGLHDDSGETAWTLDSPAIPQRDVEWVDATLRVHDGVVYALLGVSFGLGGRDFTLVALDPDGTERWRFPSDLTRFLEFAGFGDGAVVLPTHDDDVEPTGEAVIAVDLDDGRERWRVETGDAHAGGVGAGVAAVLAGEVLVDCLDLETGVRNFQFPEEHEVGTRVDDLAVGEEAVFATVDRRDVEGASLYALDPGDGSTAWSTDEERIYELRYLDDLYVAGDSLRRVAPDGSVRWRYDEEVELRDAPVDEATLYTAVGSQIVALRRRDGRERWAVEATDDTYPRVSGAGAVLSIDWRRHTTSAHGVDDGSERWRATGPEEHGPNLAVGPDGAFLATHNGSLLKVPL